AEHAVGGGDTAVKFHVVLYTTPFIAPSNWLLVALRNNDDQTLKLGTGVCLSLNSSSTKGSPVPTGTIMMWSGDENNIPDGWALCNGHSDIPGLRVPDLTGRFIVGAGPGGNHAHSVTVVIPRLGGEQALPRPPKVEQWPVLSTPPSVSAPTQASTSTSAQASASATPTSKTPVAQAPPPAVAPTWQNRPRWF